MSDDRYYDDRLQAWVTKCPPGRAKGAGDLTVWSSRRNAGRSGDDPTATFKWTGRKPKRVAVEATCEGVGRRAAIPASQKIDPVKTEKKKRPSRVKRKARLRRERGMEQRARKASLFK